MVLLFEVTLTVELPMNVYDVVISTLLPTETLELTLTNPVTVVLPDATVLTIVTVPLTVRYPAIFAEDWRLAAPTRFNVLERLTLPVTVIVLARATAPDTFAVPTTARVASAVAVLIPTVPLLA
jgi:hypothetical protein